MTEYNAASPLYSDSHLFSHLSAGMSATHIRRTMQSSIERFEASLDAEQEVAIRLATFGSQYEFYPREISFFSSNVVTFQGHTATGDPIQLVQHLSQVNFMLIAAKKVNEAPVRFAFLQG